MATNETDGNTMAAVDSESPDKKRRLRSGTRRESGNTATAAAVCDGNTDEHCEQTVENGPARSRRGRRR